MLTTFLMLMLVLMLGDAWVVLATFEFIVGWCLGVFGMPDLFLAM